MAYARQQICRALDINDGDLMPFSGLKILDVGCGGGLFAEPLSRLGAEVVGIDPGEENINMASDHAREHNLSVTYHCTDLGNVRAIETYKEIEFDVVTAMEVVEHVPDVEDFLMTASSLLKKGGILLLSTINRTLPSYLSLILGAEYLLRLVPRGTHDWRKFLLPSEVAVILRKSNMEIVDISGIDFGLPWTEWKLSKNVSANYFVTSIKGDK
jgi:2-polyprenyl-6-hydroxyphenyl methylase/3-demethylubiquinone-9 3-methyltransferase